MPSSPDKNLIALLGKKWDECTDSEKIEKLRMEAMEMQHLSTTVHHVSARLHGLERHSHADGKVVVPVLPENGFGNTIGGMAMRNNNLA